MMRWYTSAADWFGALAAPGNAEVFAAAHKHRLYQILPTGDGKAAILFDRVAAGVVRPLARRMSNYLRDFLSGTVDQPSKAIEMYGTQEVVGGGPKVFRPTPDQCAALAAIDPRIGFDDYRQPYPVMVVEYPKAYADQLRYSTVWPGSCGAGFPAAGERIQTSPLMAFVIRIGDDLLATVTQFDSGLSNVRYYPRADVGAQTLADLIGSHLPDDHGQTDHEAEVKREVDRVAINAMLAMCDLGCVALGPANPSYHARLTRLAAKADKARRPAAEAAVTSHPTLYGLPQSVRLYAVQNSDSGGPGATTGRETRPHWRRGHYRRVRCGSGRAETRIRFIRPVLVNSDRLAADAGPWTVRYRL